METKKILIINGPNLNLLGQREPEVYGSGTFDDFFTQLQKDFPNVALSYYQSNIEGELINKIQEAGFGAVDGIILNAAAYTHTSIALRDAIVAAEGGKDPIKLIVRSGRLVREVAIQWNGGLRYPRLEKIGVGETSLDRLLMPLP